MSGLPERTGLVSCRIVRNDFGENLSHIKAAAGYTTIVVCFGIPVRQVFPETKLVENCGRTGPFKMHGSKDNTTFDGLLRH
jgi:hypothetical protein